MIEQGQIEVHRHSDGRVEITQAPPVGLLGLELLASADQRVLRVTGRTVDLGDGQALYEVVGWDDTQACLVLRKTGGSR